jgi:predicted transcriptional regulator
MGAGVAFSLELVLAPRNLLIIAGTIQYPVNRMTMVKEEAIKMIENLPDESSWDDILYEIYVQKKIALGLDAAKAGRTVPHEEVRKRFAE